MSRRCASDGDLTIRSAITVRSRATACGRERLHAHLHLHRCEVVAESHPAAVARAERRLDEWLGSFEHADAGGSVSIDGRRKAQLERLGYLQ